MEKPVRPVSEAYPSVCCPLTESGSCSTEAALVNEEGDQTPIFSMSKSSMDVKVGGPPHKRDPAWTRLDLRRSSSTNTHSEQNPATLKQLPPNLWQHANSHQLALTAQNVDVQSPPALSERWMPSMQRWSGCSVGTQSRSSTPDTVVWRGGSSRPSSLTQEISSTSTPDSPMSKLTSPPVTPSPLISPLDAISLPEEDLFSPSPPSSTPNSAINQHDDEPESTSPISPLRSHQQTPESQSSSPGLHQLNSTEDEGFRENNMLTFQFPSPIPSSDPLTEAEMSLDPKCLVDDVIEKLSSPRVTQSLDDEGARNSEKLFTYMMPNSPAGEQQEAGREPSTSHLELPRPSELNRPTGRAKRSPLVSSLSDSGLGHCCKCNQSARDGLGTGVALREEATVTLQKKMVDTAVQTASPLGSCWDLDRNMSNSNMDSHSILGSPPGSRLNLKSSVGSNSNLVSPSSSMFPVSSGEEEEEGGGAKRGDDPAWDVVSASSHDLERRRSCLKMQVEEKDGLVRRSSMKQVQWDEDGMTWDVHGASVDPEVLSTAIRKHLELHNSPKVPRRSSKKKRAPDPPNTSDAVAATPSVANDATEGDGKTAAEQDRQSKGEEAAEAPRRRSRAEAELVKDEGEEVYGGGVLLSKSQRKRSVIRSLRRPGWCGGSKKTLD